MNELINKHSKEIVNKLGKNLESLILVGSYSREEEIEGLSDIEFWAVVKNLGRAKKPALDSNVSLGFTTRSHLRRLKPYIYTIEVKKFGKVLHGEKNILSLIPDYSYGDIDPIDGVILLNNRLVERLILLDKIENNQKINQYDFDKGYIQLVNSLLVLNKKYRSIYPEKLEEFRKLNINNVSLKNKIEGAFASIKQPSKLPVNKNEALVKWLELREYFRNIWLEEKRLLRRLIFKPLHFFIYRKASNIYFSDKYKNKQLRDSVIANWERFIK
ncbi:MAG: hypothetical protein WC574_00930 [Candidatus Omnitrophota bacterium]